MISQRCPKCHSDRIRRGYRPTPIWSKILFRYHLLCNECNWSFTGFAVPGTVEKENSHRRKKLTAVERTPAVAVPAAEIAIEAAAPAIDPAEPTAAKSVVVDLVPAEISPPKANKRKKKNAKR